MRVLVRLMLGLSEEIAFLTHSAVVKDVAAHHAISAKFSKPVDNKGKTLVVQYEVKLQSSYPSIIDLSRSYTYFPCTSDGLDCGGAYLKLLKENADLHADEFSNASPYVIMFGPDKCGATNKVCCHLATIFWFGSYTNS